MTRGGSNAEKNAGNHQLQLDLAEIIVELQERDADD